MRQLGFGTKLAPDGLFSNTSSGAAVFANRRECVATGVRHSAFAAGQEPGRPFLMDRGTQFPGVLGTPWSPSAVAVVSDGFQRRWENVSHREAAPCVVGRDQGTWAVLSSRSTNEARIFAVPAGSLIGTMWPTLSRTGTNSRLAIRSW